MDDLVAFLNARLDEDEQAAAVASDGPWTPWRGNPGLGLRGLEYAVTLPGQSAGSLVSIATASWLDAEHIALHDPDRELREVAFKRAILTQVVPQIVEMDQQIISEWGSSRDEPDEHLPLLKIMAAVYSDHPDYRAEWKP